MKATAAALLSTAMKAARRRLKEPIPCDDWRLEGTVRLEKKGAGLWRATIDPADPLRLRHVPTGACLCPAFRKFDTDLASVPALLQKATRGSETLHIQADSFPESAVFHDALYAAHWCWVVFFGEAQRAPVTRAQADAILYLCLACQGATIADGMAYHAGVRASGASHWRIPDGAPQWPLLFDPDTLTSIPSESPDGGNLPAESPAASVTAAPSGDSPSSDEKLKGSEGEKLKSSLSPLEPFHLSTLQPFNLSTVQPFNPQPKETP